MPELDDEIARISQRIREARDAAGLTLQELARRSEVATSTIQKVETEQMIPSVAVVLKIARGLGLHVAQLVHDGSDDLEAVHLTAGERHPVGAADKLIAERLSGDLFEPALEMWRVTLHPGVSSGSQPIEYDGEEIVVCEQGTLLFRLGEQEYTLVAGDSLHFKASIPHSWHNAGGEPVRFSVTGTLPKKFRAAMRQQMDAAAGIAR
jgi:transcriptional regulator with XRE-family HTH domain